MNEIKGSIAPNLTFFDKAGQVDEATTVRHMNWILKNGVNGLFVTGTYGSGYLMQPAQRIRVYELAKEAAASYPGAFVVAHVGANDTDTSVALTRAAARLGLDAVSAVNPYTFSYTDEELIRYYSSLVEAAGDLPVFAYNNPDLTHKAIDLKLLKKLMNAGVVAVKDSSTNIRLAMGILTDAQMTANHFRYISGTTTAWLAFRRLGCDTLIAGVCNYAPELVAGLYRLSMGADEEKALQAYRLVEKVSGVVKQGNSLLSSHLALAARDFGPTFMKAPLSVDYQAAAERYPLIRKTIDEAAAAMAALG